MGKNNEVLTDEVKDEVTDNVTVEENKEPTIADIMAMFEAQAKELAELKAEKALTQIAAAKPKPKVDPFKKLVDFELPLTQYEYEDVSVCVNGRHYQIKRGYKVRIPECIVNTIKESQAQDLETFNKIRELVEKTPV